MNWSAAIGKTVLLFDVDGVLVEPRGYRQAVRDTFAHFASQMGQTHLTLPESVLSQMEARSITVEWDMIPLCLVAVLDEIQRQSPPLSLPTTIPEAFAALKTNAPRLAHIDFSPIIELVVARLVSGAYPADVLRDAYPGDDGWVWLRRELLTGTRDVPRSDTTRHFQELVLGSEQFARTYALAPTLNSPSYLLAHDRPFLTPNASARVSKQWISGSIDVAVYTARPSRPPRELTDVPSGYAPEAELALGLVGLSDIPLIGYGKLDWYAQQKHLNIAALQKPAPFQALAAIFAAISRIEHAALDDAHTFQRTKTPPKYLEGRAWDVQVFEDSPGGIIAVQKAGEMLRAAGVDVQVRAWGIAVEARKVDALASVGAQVVSNVNDVLTGQ